MDQPIASAPQEFYQSIQNSLSPTSPEPPKPFSWLKWVLLLVVVALISSGGTYFVLQQSQNNQQPTQTVQITPTPTPDPTANWKTYTSGKGSYSLKYPDNLVAREVGSSGQAAQYETPRLHLVLLESANFEFPSGVAVEVLDNKESLSIEEFVRKNISDYSAIRFRPFTIDGVEGRRTSDIAEVNNHEEVFVKRGTIVYRIFVSFGSDQVISMSTFDQILSTFKFLE